jgi:outer membrane lipoprotein-sorting protein
MKALNLFILLVFICAPSVFAMPSKKAEAASKAKVAARVEADSKAATAKAEVANVEDNMESVPVAAQALEIKPGEQQEVLNKFLAWDKNLKTLTMGYEQITTFEGMTISSSEGKIYKKDNKIRLDTLEDDKVAQSAITDKKTIKILDDKGDFVTGLSWEQWRQSQANKALFDFGNYAALLNTHKVKKIIKNKKTYAVTLVPLDTAQSGYELEFVLNNDDYFPQEISISNEGVKTRTALKNAEKNIEIKESLFK